MITPSPRSSLPFLLVVFGLQVLVRVFFIFTIEPPFVLGRWNSPSERCEGRALQIQPLVGIERKAYAERALLPVGEEAATSRAFIFYSSICVFLRYLCYTILDGTEGRKKKVMVGFFLLLWSHTATLRLKCMPMCVPLERGTIGEILFLPAPYHLYLNTSALAC